ncbi:Fe-S cluster assembly sulfur transfer protein SufU [Arthrobacter crystallopoietes]|uniref:Fe-S cluster assembly sulfur transfer protein SufU n=1 Tax=Crystallibacter crystallopoietes TaxID=37928 RepID=UPI001ABD9CA6|nr:SUF system NifU family Fe-S cluster assembly protein [Arthrobacter crystallopoietes]QTG79510.1 SUF system NifU family Fe-S cluster assembly protein [Arthrobacter crystallopoietes]
MSSELEQLYQQIILEHAKLRHGAGLAEPPEGDNVGESHMLNPTCGDEITLRASVHAEGDERMLSSISWDGQGCSISMASASVLSDMALSMERSELIKLIDQFREVMRSRGSIAVDEEILGDAAAFSGVSKYPARVKCAMLAWVALEEALLAAN